MDNISISKVGDCGLIGRYTANGIDALTLLVADKHLSLSTDKCIMTYRSFSEYFPKGFAIKSDKCYVEIGPDLAEFIPRVVRKLGNNLRIRPIAIEPMNYAQVIKLLYAALNEKMSSENERTVKELLGRAKIMSDARKVRLYNTTFCDAIARFPELEGCGDLVIDVMGACVYEPDDNCVSKCAKYYKIRKLEKQLLKPELSGKDYRRYLL